MRIGRVCCFFFNDPATTEIYTLSLHDALPIWTMLATVNSISWHAGTTVDDPRVERVRDAYLEPFAGHGSAADRVRWRSEEHTSELQSRQYLVCRLLLEKTKQNFIRANYVRDST